MNNKPQKPIPRWQQGLRPGAYGDVWDKMSPSERRWAFFSDIAVALLGAAVIFAIYAFKSGGQ